MQDSERIEQENRDLQEQADVLRAEKLYLQQLLSDHMTVCQKENRAVRMCKN